MSNLLKTLQKVLEDELTDIILDVYDVEVTCNGVDIDVDYFDVYLERYLVMREDQCDYAFATLRKPIRQLSNRAIQNEINNIEKRCTLNKKMHPHTFRHTLAQSMLDNGASLEEVQHILGHANISTTQVYAHVSEERKKQSHRRFA